VRAKEDETVSILKKLQDTFGPKDPNKKAELLYQKSLELVKREKFREAVSLLEEASGLNPVSAPIHNILAFSYVRIADEYTGDEKSMNYWVNKSAEIFWKAIMLHREYGGLEPKQVSTAMEMVAAVDRINMEKSNTPQEKQRKSIFVEYKSKRESGFDFFSAAGDIIRGNSLTDMYGSLRQHSSDAEGKAIAHVTTKFGISERQLRAIIQEGGNKKW
jgi:tetratricopeptide (TPR) repeat protein